MTTQELLELSKSDKYAGKKTVVVDKDSRKIIFPKENLLLGVESDELTERIVFLCPRVVGDDKDLTTFQIRIIYRNANHVLDYDICTDTELSDSEDYIVFSWEVSRKATAYKGITNFIMCAFVIDENGEIQNEWNTTLAKGNVLEGLETRNFDDQPENEIGIIEQLLSLNAKVDKLSKEVEQLKANGGGTGGSITVDDALSETSANPVQNKVVTEEFRRLSEEIAEIRSHTRNIFEGEFEQGNISSSTGADDNNLPEYYVRTTDYIPVDTSIVAEDNQCYIMLSYTSYMDKMRVAYYDENKAFISMTTGSSSSESLYNRKEKFFIVPSNVRYIRFATCGSNGTNQYTPSDISEPQIEYGYTPTDYVQPYTAYDITARECVDELKTGVDELKTGVDELKTGVDELKTGVENTENIFRSNELEQGNINYSTGENSDTTGAYYVRCKNHISVEGEKKYTISFISPMNTLTVYYYDEDKVLISSGERTVMGVEGRAYTRKRVCTITTPENCVFIRFKIYGSNGTVTYTPDEVSEMQVVEGGGLPYYIPPITNVDYTVRSMVDFPVQYACGRILCIGDSLTEGHYAHGGAITGTIINENYPYYLGRMLNAEVTNTGKSGGYPSKWIEEHTDYDFSPFDTVIIWFGINGGLSVDDIAVSGTETLAYNELIQAVRTSNATCKITLATVFATGELSTGVTPYSVQVTNEAVRALADMHNADVVDMAGMGYEMHPELHSTTDTTHFTKAGNIYVASRFVKHMRDTFDVANVEFGLSVAR